MSWKSIACVVLVSSLVFGAVGCGSQGTSVGFGSFTLTSVAPNPVPGMIPTAVTITGGDFSNVIGTEVEVKWCAPAGTIPFLGGTSDEATSVGTITSATTIDTITPRAVICGPTSLDVIVKITLPSGVWGSSVVPILTFLAPTMTSISGGGVFPAAIPTPFTITGTGYGDIGSPVTIHWRSTDVAVPTPFEAGSSATIETQGVVASATTITGVSPLALVCGPASASAEIYKIYFQDGSCTPDTNPPLGVTFVAPTVTAAVNTGGLLDNGTNNFAAALPESFTLTGTGYGPVGGTATINITAAANPIFENGTSTTTAVTGTIISATQIDAPLSAAALMCNNPPGITTENVTFDVVLPDGSCTPTGAGTAGVYNAPAFTSITNTQVGSPHVTTNTFAAAVPEPFDIVGTRFGPIGGIAIVQWEDNGAPTPYEGGTSNTTTVLGEIISPTLIRGVSPEAALCDTLLASAQNIQVTCEGGSCSPNAIAAASLQAPTATAIANIDRGGGTFFSAIPETFEVTGTDFGPIGGTATVRFTVDAATAAGTAATPFNGGTAAFVDVLATITSRTTLEGVSPEALLCPNPLVDPATQLVAGIDLDVTLEGGSCTQVGAPLNVSPLIVGPTLAGATLLSPTPPPAGVAGGPALDVPTTLVLGQDDPYEFEITGTGFAPLGAIVLVTFDDIGLGAGAADLNGAATLTVPAVVVSETLIRGELPLITTPRLTEDEPVRTTVTLAPNGSCAYDDALVNLAAPPTITSVVNNEIGGGLLSGFTGGSGDVFTCAPSNMTIDGTNLVWVFNAIDDFVLYSTNNGLDANTDQPLRRMGSATPPPGVIGDLGADVPPGVVILTFPLNDVIFRTEPVGPELDTDNDGLVPYTLRVVNDDGQYHDFAAGDYVLRSSAFNLGTSGNIRNNNSIAANPISFTDDFQNPGADPTDAVTGANLIAVSNDEVPGGGFGLFNATDILLGRSLDGGATWTTAPLGAAAIDGLAAGANRSFAKVACDALGNTWMVYVVDDFGGIAFDASIVQMISTDSGGTWAPAGLAGVTTFGPGTAGTINFLDVATGPSSVAGSQKLLFTWVDSSPTFAPWDVVRIGETDSAGLGLALNIALGPAISDTVVAPPAFTIAANECAVGNSGETYAGWQEPTFAAPPFTTNFMFDVDRDGFSGASFSFGPDIFAFSDFVPFFVVPLYADISFFEPSMDLAVSRAGTNAGRVLWVYDHIAPNAGGSPDHSQILARYSDDRGQNWSSGVATHPIDSANRIIPAVCSDPVTGRFYLTWYDGTPGLGNPAPQAFDRRGSASDDGVSWGTVLNLSGARGSSAHVVDFDTDFGAYAGVCAYNGCVYATWSDTVDSGANADPVVVGYQQK